MHAINVLFNAHNEEEWGILMVDASSTFNSINSLAILYSQGVTQRDPLLMLVYAMVLFPLSTLSKIHRMTFKFGMQMMRLPVLLIRTCLVSYLKRVLHMVTSQSLRKVSLQSV